MGVSRLSPMDGAPPIPARGRSSTQIRHFNGTTRRTSEWDGLRKDTQLWFENEDCLVHFYSHQASQRGASLRIPFTTVKNLNSAFLMDRCLRKTDRSQSAPRRYGYSDRRYLHLRNDYIPERSTYELYIPAPPGCTREQAFSYHLTTRNLFAYAMGFPLVGARLSSALVDLWSRFQEWNIHIQLSTFTTYLEKQGYMDFTESTEHSLACLQLAEAGRLRSIWIESFVHSVGMRERLDLSPEYEGVSKTTSALIMRAALEMDLHITRVVKAVGSFLEHELSSAYVGLPKPTRDHLDLFRSFLHSFYVNRFGYFPPRMTTPWNKRPWTTMHADFQHLYNYLADTESSADWTSHRILSGGFCVIQNVQSFDKHHGYQPLPHPLPLLPRPDMKRQSSSKGLRSLSSLRRSSSVRSSMSSNIAFEVASNPLSAEAMRSSLVEAYRRFENEAAASKAKVDAAEARKVRWLLIYGVLQMLSSVIRAPAEVRDTETPSYPLCVLTSGCPPWTADEATELKTALKPQASNEKMLVLALAKESQKEPSKVSIRPDCEAESADEFFTSRNLSRQNSFRSQKSLPPVPLKRSGAIRSSLNSVVGSLARRHSHRMSLPAEQSVMANRVNASVSSLPPSLREKVLTPPPRNPIRDFDFGFNPKRSTLITEDQLLEESVPSSPIDPTPSPSSESDSSHSSKQSSDSGRSSYLADEVTSPATEYSSWDVGSNRSNSITNLSSLHIEPLATKRTSGNQLIKPDVDAPRHVEFSTDTYIPTGMVSSPSKKGHAKRPSVASSVYPEGNVQAADIDESDMRGRRRIRGLTDLSDYGIVLGETNVW